MSKREPRKYIGPSHIGDSLKNLFQGELKSPNFGTELRIWEFWEKAVGQEIARNATPKLFKNGILFVETRHAMWTTELQLRNHQIRQKLNAALGQDFVKEIHFKIGQS